MTRRSRDGMAALALLAAVVGLGAGLLGFGADLAYVGPAAVLALALLCGLYPGEEALARALDGRRAHPRATASSRPVPPARSVVPRGGALLGSRLASRAPPRCALP